MNCPFYTADDVAAALKIKKSTAYKVVRLLNAELKSKGFLILTGRVPIEYFNERYAVVMKGRKS